MKFRNIFIAAVAAICAMACEKSEKPVINNADAVAGTYHGWTSAEFAYSPTPMVTADETVILTADGDNITVSFTSSTWGEFTLDAAVTVAGDKYMIAGSGSTLMGMTPESKKEYAATVEGSVDKSGTTQMIFKVPSVMGGLTVTFTEGDAPEN